MYKYIILLLLGAFVSSCDNFLTKETISDLPADGFPSNEKDAEGLVAGMYDAIQTTLETTIFIGVIIVLMLLKETETMVT